MRIDGVGVAAIAAGGLLIYAGARGFSVPAAAQNIIQGNSPAAGQAPSALASSAAAAASSPAAPSSPTGNVKLGQMMAAARGWTGAEWNALYALWQQESGWSTTARNASSGATGIPQLNPSSHAIPPGWSSASVQIQWGLDYIASTYGDPIAAEQHEKTEGWY